MNYLAGILIINIVIAVITDMTDWPSTLKSWISTILSKGKTLSNNYKLHLVDCSLCLTFHLSNIWLIVYLLLGGTFNMWFLVAPALSAVFVSVTSEIILLLKDIVLSIINKLHNLIV